MVANDAAEALNGRGGVLEACLQGEDPNIHQELVDDFEGATEAVAHITQAKGIINRIFFGPEIVNRVMSMKKISLCTCSLCSSLDSFLFIVTIFLLAIASE